MYPSGELAGLAARKAVLQARIAVHRWECRAAAVELAKPVAFLDRALERWRAIAPFAAFLSAPAGLLFTRFLRGRSQRTGKRRGKVATLIALAPLLMRGFKLVMALRATHTARQAAEARGDRVPATAAD